MGIVYGSEIILKFCHKKKFNLSNFSVDRETGSDTGEKETNTDQHLFYMSMKIHLPQKKKEQRILLFVHALN